MKAPNPVHAGTRMQQLASDLYVELDADGGAILHGSRARLIAICARFGFRASPRVTPDRPLARVYLTRAKAARLSEVL